MTKSSINFQGVKATSEQHNERRVSFSKEGKTDQKYLDYVRIDLKGNNEHQVDQSIYSRTKTLKETYQNFTGRKLPSNSKSIREGVMNLQEHHTLEDCVKVAERLKAELGVTVFQIHIHRDEGRWIDPRRENITITTKTPHVRPQPNAIWLPNYHAHLVADWTNPKTGKSLDLKSDDLRRMQTIVAEGLDMERGKSSDKKHLDAITYKIEERKKELEILLEKTYKDIEVTEKNLLGKDKVNFAASIDKAKQLLENQKLLILKLQDEIKALKKEVVNGKEALKKMNEVRLKVQRSFQVILQAKKEGEHPDLSQFLKEMGSLFLEELNKAHKQVQAQKKRSQDLDKGKSRDD